MQPPFIMWPCHCQHSVIFRTVVTSAEGVHHSISWICHLCFFKQNLTLLVSLWQTQTQSLFYPSPGTLPWAILSTQPLPIGKRIEQWAEAGLGILEGARVWSTYECGEQRLLPGLVVKMAKCLMKWSLFLVCNLFIWKRNCQLRVYNMFLKVKNSAMVEKKIFIMEKNDLSKPLLYAERVFNLLG